MERLDSQNQNFFLASSATPSFDSSRPAEGEPVNVKHKNRTPSDPFICLSPHQFTSHSPPPRCDKPQTTDYPIGSSEWGWCPDKLAAALPAASSSTSSSECLAMCGVPSVHDEYAFGWDGRGAPIRFRCEANPERPSSAVGVLVVVDAAKTRCKPNGRRAGGRERESDDAEAPSSESEEQSQRTEKTQVEPPPPSPTTAPTAEPKPRVVVRILSTTTTSTTTTTTTKAAASATTTSSTAKTTTSPALPPPRCRRCILWARRGTSCVRRRRR